MKGLAWVHPLAEQERLGRALLMQVSDARSGIRGPNRSRGLTHLAQGGEQCVDGLPRVLVGI